MIKTLVISTLGLAAPLLAQVTLPVSANMDIFRAGGYNDGSDGLAPAVYSFPAQALQTLTFSAVNGLWTCTPSVAQFGADGTTTGHCAGRNFANPTGPFSGYNLTDFASGMVGMFLGDSLPTQPPPSLRFYVSNNADGGISTAFQTLQPAIGQVFFIGDGLTGTGAGSIQTFSIPSNATHLYLGFADSCTLTSTVPGCYSDNTGSLSVTVQTQGHQLNWVEPSLSQAPAPRCCIGIAYDYATHSTLLFGGGANPSYFGDTWSLAAKWTQLFPATSPSARMGPGMAWDGAAENIVLFGGTDSTGTKLNDTWTWDGTNWTQQFPAVSPPARELDVQAMNYDPVTRTVVLFGGRASSTPTLGDTWTWDGVAKTWTQQFPAASPSARTAPMAFDAITRTLVLFGGDNDSGTQYTDTWTWNGTTWTQHFPATSPSARTNANMAYDGSLGVVVLFGGFAGSWPDTLSDTWTWNGLNWTKMNPATVPPNRYAEGMTFDPLARGIMMFGGYSSGPVRNDTWVYLPVPTNGADQ